MRVLDHRDQCGNGQAHRLRRERIGFRQARPALRVELDVQLAVDALHQRRRDGAEFVEAGAEQQPVAQAVDARRHTAGGALDRLERRRRDGRPLLPADAAQAMFDVGGGLGRLERGQMTEHVDAVTGPVRRVLRQPLAQRGLADERELHGPAVPRCQAQQGVQRVARQLVRVVDDDEAAPAVGGERGQMRLQRRPRLAVAGRVTECGQQRLRQVVGAEARPDQLRDGDGTRVEPSLQRLQQQCLADADLTRDDDAAAAFERRVPEVGQGAFVGRAREIEIGVRGDRERAPAQAEVRLVHRDTTHQGIRHQPTGSPAIDPLR